VLAETDLNSSKGSGASAGTRPNKVSVKLSLTSPITLQALSNNMLSANRQVIFLENIENKAVPQLLFNKT
jgi:hypothetical protein